jgi:hypothetical protein
MTRETIRLESTHGRGFRLELWLLASLFILYAPPALLYAYSRWSGSLVSEHEWMLHEGNHGPWYSTLEGGVLGWFMTIQLAVLPLSLVGALICLFSKLDWKGTGKVWLCLLTQIVLFVSTWHLLFWTID